MSEEKPKVVIRYSGKKILEEMFLLMPKLGQSLLPCLLRYFLNYQIEDMEIKDQLNSDNHPEIIFSFVLELGMIFKKIKITGHWTVCDKSLLMKAETVQEKPDALGDKSFCNICNAKESSTAVLIFIADDILSKTKTGALKRFIEENSSSAKK